MDYDFITTCNWTSTGTFTLRAFRGSDTDVATSHTLYYRKKGSPTWSSTSNGQINITSTGEWEVANNWNKSGYDVLTHSYWGITAINTCTNVYFNEENLGVVIGNNFLRQGWVGCINLTSMPEGFNLPSEITSVGNDFLFSTWGNCTGLVSMSEGFNLPQGIVSVGNDFLFSCFRECKNLVSMPRGFSIPSGIISVGNNFLYFCWYGCTNLKQDGYTEDLVFEFDSSNTFAGTCPIVPDSITGASKENPVYVAINRPAPPPLRYWVLGSGLWTDASHWSFNSGGSGGASVPTSDDDVFIDNNSGFNSGGTITAPLGVCKGLVLSPGIAIDLGNSQIDIASLQAIGTSDNLISITGGTLSKPSGFVQCDYLNLTNSTATGGAKWYAGEHSIDGGDNSGWLFRNKKYPLPARPWKA